MRYRVLLPILVAVAGAFGATVSAPAYAADPTARYPIDGIDIASWQHPGGAPIDWIRVRHAHINFVTVKATEGSPADQTGYVNPYLAGDMNGARGQGMPVAPYHFYLGRTPGTGAAQARHFIAAVRAVGYTGKRRNDLPPILDFEWDWKGGCPPYGTFADAKAWLDTVRAAFGRTPVIYTNANFVTGCLGGTTALSNYRLQVSDYSHTSPTLPPGARSWWAWQWTASSCVDGVPTCSLTRSVFNGTGKRLLSDANR
jgi:lysozyme